MNINDFLYEIKLINWFAHSGVPNENYHRVLSIFEAYDNWNKQMLKVWEPSITLLENMAIEKIGDAQIDEIFSTISADIGEILWEKWGEFIARQHLEDEMGLDNEIIDMVKRDVSWAFIEKTLNIRGLFTTLLEIYKSGYFPCSWIGTYPDGQAVVL